MISCIKLFLVIITVVILAATVAIILLSNSDVDSKTRNLIPQKIEVTKRFLEGTKTLSIGGCGVVGYWIKESTALAIQQNGKDFFSDIVGEKIFENGRSSQHYYLNWKESPLPENYFGEGKIVSILACETDLSEEWKQKIINEAKKSGNFYTEETSTADVFLILPNLRLIILFYN